MNTNEQQPINSLDDNTVYRASIHFYSKGKGENVTLAVDVSHVLADEMEGNQIPASYMQVYEQVMQLRRNATLFEPMDGLLDAITDDTLSPEAKAAAILAQVQAEEERLSATVN